MTGPEFVIVAIAAIAFLGSVAGSLAKWHLHRRKKSSPTQKLTRIVVEPADDGESGEAAMVEFEGPIPLKELFKEIRYVEYANAQQEYAKSEPAHQEEALQRFQRFQRAQQEQFLRLQRVLEEKAETVDRAVRMWDDLARPSALDEGHQPPDD